MQIARAFKEEILSSGAENNRASDVLGNEDEENVPDYSHFRIPKNTYAIAIDDSKIQRKLLGKFFDFAGISSDQQTIVGDGYDEIMASCSSSVYAAIRLVYIMMCMSFIFIL